MRLIDLDDERHCFICSDAEYDTWNIDPEAPTVDAVPISFIQKRISYLQEIADYEFEASGGYTGEASTQLNELRRLIVSWSMEKQND